VETVGPRPPGAAADPARLIEERARAAGVSEFLGRARRARRPLTLVLNDPDRFTDSRTALTAIFELGNAQVPPFRVLFAAGSHRFTADVRRRHEEQALGSLAARATDIAWHDCRQEEALLPLGGARLHGWVRDADFVLAIGSMEPHYFAGVTGAHKTLTVGVLSYDGIRENHRHALSPSAKSLCLAGNPVYEGISALALELTETEKSVFAVNEVLVDGRPVFCTAGDPLQSLALGLPVVRRTFCRRLPRAVDLVVAHVTPPLAGSLYQADKGIKNVETAVRDGGVILLEASCDEGIGIDRFFQLMERAPTYEKALELVESEGYQLGDHKAIRLRALSDRRGVKLGVVSSHLDPREARVAGLEPFTEPEQAARWALGQLGGKGRRAALVEDAGNMTLLI
jgi:nickel-dependent lactate racemase